MNREHIEIDAIDYLKYKLKISNRITPDFKEKDKAPSWDGNIHLSESGKQGKLGRYIPVQIKGTRAKEFGGNTISHPVDVNDLINYREHHGTIFFVVQMRTRTKGKIYFEYLLPSDVSRYLNGKEKQKTVNIKLRVFDVSSAHNIEDTLETFVIEYNKQNNQTLHTDDISMLSSFSIPARFIQEIDFAKSMIGRDVYLHGESFVESKRIEFVSRVNISGVVEHLNFEVKVKDKVFYTVVNESHDLNGRTVEIGTGFRFTIGDSTFYFKDKGTLSERILNYEFLCAINEEGGFTVGEFLVSDVKANFDIIDAKDNLSRLKRVQDFLDFLGVKEDLDVNLLPQEQVDILNHLIAIRYDKVRFNGHNLGTFKVGIMEKNYLVYLRKSSDNYLEVINPFSAGFEPNIISYSDEGNENQFGGISIFLAIGDGFIDECSNIVYSKIESSLLTSTLNESVFPRFNEFCLKLIDYFDLNGNIDALKCAVSCLERIVVSFDNESKIIAILNLYQSFSRLRDLTEIEVGNLISVRESERLKEKPSIEIIWAVNVILQNKAEAKMEWNKFDEDSKDSIAKYPIYKLYAKLIS